MLIKDGIIITADRPFPNQIHSQSTLWYNMRLTKVYHGLAWCL
ncbi:hypothetical protein AO385_1710 [Moraxella catarrhalis]|uniref:Uncharacterized protein n=1 Tax=Moraxella catarrhalis TaxID=480 RepID=A0A198UMR1_MORCA|nr:hypothetical protein AO383_1699 [Moraxella catarrhalis]OAU97648.1 hypothetical protein AO385_1710 [Moraxella catarrhalis]OAU97778.1 hypothetical protein AO384_0464 [Moraxella catarrhalis]OAU99351.1 hypothetical protein AO382_1996 [Moraxella catarrhalis]